MSTIMISMKDGAPADALEKAKSQAKEQGGEIVHEYPSIKGFAVKFPADKVHTFKTNEHMDVEKDQSVTTQA